MLEMKNNFQKSAITMIPILTNHKWMIFFALMLASALYVGVYIAYPKSEIVMGMQSRNIDEATGQPKASLKEFYELKERLAQKGVDLTFTTQKEIGRNESDEKSNLEFLVEGKTKADFVLAENTGAKISEEVKARFSTLGAVEYRPILFYIRKGNNNIQFAKDLVGKRIILWSSPEGHEQSIQSYLESKASPYSNDYVIQDVMKSYGITPSNTKIINAWPDKISLKQDWDVWMALSLPRKDSKVSDEMYEALERGDIEILDLKNVLGLARNLRYLKPIVIPASTYSIARNFPATDIQTLAINTDIIVRNDLDSGLVMALAEGVQNVFSASNKLWDKNEFPNFTQYSQFDPNHIAKDYYKNGAPFLNKYFPPYLSTVISKLFIVLLPVITIFWPLFHFVPSAYGFFVKRRISRWYKELEILERNYLKADAHDKEELLKSFHIIEQGIRSLKIPFLRGKYVQELFDARVHIELIKQKLAQISPNKNLNI